MAELKQKLLEDAIPFVSHLLPGGVVVGNEYECANLGGGPGKSCKVNVKTGLWSDFATGEQGGDLISLYAAVQGVDNKTAFKDLAQRYLPRDKPSDRLPKLEQELANAKIKYEYQNAENKPVLWIVRYEKPDGKIFVPFIPVSYTHLTLPTILLV